jgi:CBS domain-containing protein
MNSTSEILKEINLEHRGNMKRLIVQMDANKPTTGMLGTMLVIEAGKLYGITQKLDSYRKIFLAGASSVQPWLIENMIRVGSEASPGRVLEHCRALTKEKGTQHLPVAAGGRLIGIISMEDLVNTFLVEIYE